MSTPLHTWPPLLADFKTDLGISLSDVDNDANLSSDLAAAVAYVQRVRPTFDYANNPMDCKVPVTDDLWNGTVAYARRLYQRRRSPDGVVSLGDQGVGRVPVSDPDIERMLGIGRYQGPVFS
jgi:hypothetical protein